MLNFENLGLINPLTGENLRIKSLLRHPTTNRVWYGSLVNKKGEKIYPIIEGVVRIVDSSDNAMAWIDNKEYGKKNQKIFQSTDSVEFFGFEWTLFPRVNNEEELKYRIEKRYNINVSDLKGKLILDTGCGCGDESEFFLKHGARVVSIDLSDTIDVASKRLSLYENWIGIKGDITKLPFNNEVFDFVYCEGVIQHTRDTKQTLKELVRVLKRNGNIAVWHYGKPEKQSFYNKYFTQLREKRRKKFSKWDRHKFIAYSAFLTSLGYIPILGDFLKQIKFISKKSHNRTFQANWAMTMDALGWHEYQRYITKKEFKNIFNDIGKFKVVFEDSSNPIFHYKKL